MGYIVTSNKLLSILEVLKYVQTIILVIFFNYIYQLLNLMLKDHNRKCPPLAPNCGVIWSGNYIYSRRG